MKDKLFSMGVASVGAAAGFFFGGWTPMLTVLVAAAVLDYLTGIAAGYVEGKLSSKVGFRNIPKKIMIFVLVAVAHFIDVALGENHLFRDAVIFFYLANEIISIIENAGRMGVPVPEQLRQAVQVLRGKGKR